MNEPALVVLAELADVARAGVAAMAVRAHHEGCPVFIVVSDGPTAVVETELAGAARLGLDDLSLPYAARVSIGRTDDPVRRRLATRPWAISAVMDRTGRDVVEVPPDSLVLRRFADQLDTGSDPMSVVARCLHPPPRDGSSPDARALALLGHVDDGTARVRAHRDSRDLLRWWKRDVIAALRSGTSLLGWSDIAAFASARVVRDPGLVVSAWNLHERPLADSSHGFTAGGAPLRVLRTGGLESGSAWPPGLPSADRRRPHEGDDAILAALIGDHLARVATVRRQRTVGIM